MALSSSNIFIYFNIQELDAYLISWYFFSAHADMNETNVPFYLQACDLGNVLNLMMQLTIMGVVYGHLQ